jgi:hypothetical protein
MRATRLPDPNGLDALDDEDALGASPADHAPGLIPDPDDATEAKLTPSGVLIANADQRSVKASLPNVPRATAHRTVKFMTAR